MKSPFPGMDPYIEGSGLWEDFHNHLVEGIYRAMGYEQRDPLRPQFTDHCFTGDYPTPLTDQTGHEASPRQLSLLAEAS